MGQEVQTAVKFVISDERIPIKVWAKRPEELELHQNVFMQARNLANHPLVRKWVCLMPDYHLGYGMPIGGVIATRGGVIPNAVGVDIGCGMIAVKTPIEAASLSKKMLQQLRLAIHDYVPVGFNKHVTARLLPQDLIDSSEVAPIVRTQLAKAGHQIGTLGGGNHFIEIQRDDSGYVWIMLHSGSRNVGLKVCNHYSKVAKDYMESFATKLPDSDLAFLPDAVPESITYLIEMNWCMKFAEASRKMVLDSTFRAFISVGFFNVQDISLSVDTHHNFAAMEHHYDENYLIHRKGAVKAEGLVTIPGSMGTSSYIGQGRMPQESFHSCAHGAGRTMSRTVAKKTITHERAVETMGDVVYGIRQGEYDEMPDAYKDIDEIMMLQLDLVEPVHRLTPLAVVKG